MTGQLCRCGCGEPATVRGCSKRCYDRWHYAGFPEGGPRPPLAPAECGRRSGAARTPEPDPYDLQWLAGEPERRIARTRGQAADLVRVVAARDGGGVSRLLEKITDHDALLILLAECADPYRTAVVTGRAPLAAVPSEGAPAHDAEQDAEQDQSRPVSVACDAIEGGTRAVA